MIKNGGDTNVLWMIATFAPSDKAGNAPEGKERKGKERKRKRKRVFFRNTKSIKLIKITTMQFTNGSNLMSF